MDIVIISSTCNLFLLYDIAWKLLTWLNNNYSLSASSQRLLFHFLQRTVFHFLQRTVFHFLQRTVFHYLLSWYSHKSIWLPFLTKDLCLLFLIMWAGEYYSVRGSGINYTSKLKNLSIIQHISEWILFMLLTIDARRGAGTEITSPPPPPHFLVGFLLWFKASDYLFDIFKLLLHNVPNS